jgi:hypothetical protein
MTFLIADTFTEGWRSRVDPGAGEPSSGGRDGDAPSVW